MRGKAHRTPFLVLALALLLFGRKKPPQGEKPTLVEPFPVPEVMRKTVTESDLSKSRDTLRLANLERDIMGDALTKIYEAETKGQINEIERNQLVQRYKVDLKRVDSEIETHKRVVDLHELESAKEDLLKSFHEKLMEIDARIERIKPGVAQSPLRDLEAAAATSRAPKQEPAQAGPAQPASDKEKQTKEKPKNKAEERLEAIREEVLKAMERLEQIETEG